ncbi:MAG: PRC-barrel domain-containing protein [Veillonellales bacterium]
MAKIEMIYYKKYLGGHRMKKSVDIIGLPVISITEGKELGTITRFVINPGEGSVEAFVVDDGKWYMGAKLLLTSSVTGIGESAVTVDNSNSIFEVKEAPDLERLLIADINVIGTKVLTKAGELRGKVTEIVFDETGKFIFCEAEENGETAQIPAERVVTFGKDVLIVTGEDEVQNTPVTKSKPLESASAVIAAAPAFTEKPAVPEPAVAVQETASEDTGKKFDDKHRKYLLGKKASRRIETDNGMLIVEQGGEITEEVLQKAKLAGKFVELSMNIQ